MEIALGTAQFGPEAYGITDKRILQEYEIGAILQTAFKCNIRAFDTAPAYQSEHHLNDLENVRIVTKVSSGANPKGSLEASLQRLGRKKIHGLLLHDPMNLDFHTFEELQSCKGKVDKIGVSIYDIREIPDFPIDIIQIPISALDQRFLKHLEGLKKRGIEIWARSVFCQGLIFQKSHEIELKNEGIRSSVRTLLDRFHDYCELVNSKPHHVSLGFLKGTGLIDYALCGAKSIYEVESITGMFNISSLGITEGMGEMLDPRFW